MERITGYINWREAYEQLGTSPCLQRGFSGQSVQHGGIPYHAARCSPQTLEWWNTKYICFSRNPHVKQTEQHTSYLKDWQREKKHFCRRSVMSTCANCQHLRVNPKEVKCAAIWTFLCFNTLNLFQEQVIPPFVLRRSIQTDTFPLVLEKQSCPNDLIYFSMFILSWP